jgi:hypothetical protein
MINMKSFTKPPLNQLMLPAVISLFIFSGCRKEFNQPQENRQEKNDVSTNNHEQHGQLTQTDTYSSDVVIKWISLNNRILFTTVRSAPGVRQSREFAYTGIALYESVVPGMPAYRSLGGRLNEMPAMPAVQPGMAYHWPACANAALAAINRLFFPTVSATLGASMDSLEAALNLQYRSADGINEQEFQRSVAFGKAVAQRVFDWSKTDGSDHAFDAYIPPDGPGLWVPTPPAFRAAAAPYWGNNRTIVQGSIEGALPPPPVTYSADPSSDFFRIEKEVYDVSQSLTADQKAIGLFWLDDGIQGGGHWLSILRQVLANENAKLDIAALAYAMGGIYTCDATISTFKTKYTYNLERPVTYIRNVLNHPAWNALFATPAHPDYSSAHCVQSSAIAIAFSSIFGDNYQFTDHTGENIGMVPQHYNSFKDVANQVALARVYAGIHTSLACRAGLQEGKKVAENIDNKLDFKKE